MKNGSSRNKTAGMGKKSKTSTRILGPVSDLERHVRSDWWRNIFNYLYLKTDADVVDDQSITSSEIDFISEILLPVRIRDRHEFTFKLKPLPEEAPEGLLERAGRARAND